MPTVARHPEGARKTSKAAEAANHGAFMNAPHGPRADGAAA